MYNQLIYKVSILYIDSKTNAKIKWLLVSVIIMTNITDKKIGKSKFLFLLKIKNKMSWNKRLP